MPTRPPVRCPTCKRLHRGKGTCPTCTIPKQQAKDARRPARRTAAETSRRRQAVADHVTMHGWWCPGLGDHTPHPSPDLTAHHMQSIPDAMAHGLTYAQAEAGPLRVLCRSENSRIAERTSIRT